MCSLILDCIYFSTFVFCLIVRQRSPDGSLSEYKKGPAVFAIKTKATIVPIVIKGNSP